MTTEDAQQLALNGSSFGDLYPALDNDEERRLFKAWWLAEPTVPVVRSSPQEKIAEPSQNGKGVGKLPPVPSGNSCKTCGGLMVRAGKCEYCPQGCGSEGECS